MQVISHNTLASWLDAIAAEKALIAPRNVDGVLLYRQVAQAGDIAWDGARPRLSAKEALFPPTEPLLTIDIQGQQVTLNETFPQGEQVLFGLRPCDARGIQALDALFIDHEPADAYYARRRANTTLIGLACQEMGDTCFCTSVGGAPDDPTGLDLLLSEVDGGFAVTVVTERGAAIAQALPQKTVPGEPPAPKLKDESPTIPDTAIWPQVFTEDAWADLSERCLSCRICAYVCPTCRCFDVRDEASSEGNGAQQFERVRCWDSCAGEAYRRIAGGHNPRAAKGERLRNRFFCKFYYYPAQYGPLACTGCGRCIDACPVNIDLVEVLGQVARFATEAVQP